MDKTNLTLGSLFDGSGGFPLAGLLSGITPVWKSEIEPFPILVTQKRLPFVKHYGDVSTLDGGKLPPVDIITFGSPCQDMSIAGKREGLGGSRSNLFYEVIRIVKEMRCATDGRYPKYIIWENVPGAFSSNKGEDFRLSEDKTLTLVAQDHGHHPCILDAAGFCTEHSAKARGIGYEEEKSPTLRAGVVPAAVYENHSQDARYTGPLTTAPTVSSTYGAGGNNQPFVVKDSRAYDVRIISEGHGFSRRRTFRWC